MKRLPLFTFCACGAALLTWFFPGLVDRLVYDREAILGGEVWRLLTGHLVHFSPSHLVMDVAALALAGSLLELRTCVPRPILFLVAPGVISLVLLLFEPAMARYGGLSGLATTTMVYLALHMLADGLLARTLGLAALVGLAAKITLEWNGSSPLFATMADDSVVAAPLSHAAGAGLALLLFGMQKAHGRHTDMELAPSGRTNAHLFRMEPRSERPDFNA